MSLGVKVVLTPLGWVLLDRLVLRLRSTLVLVRFRLHSVLQNKPNGQRTLMRATHSRSATS